jgi:ribonuclease HII
MVTKAFKGRFHKNFFEQSAWKDGNLICGIDEVGRGCLAGPVVVAAVALFPNKLSRHLRDSKIMTLEEREKAYRWIIKNSWNSIALIHHRAIDTNNIYCATLIAMKRAYMQLMTQVPKPPSSIIVDAMPLKLENSSHHETDVYYFPFGESKSSSIAAASIIAKVTRDRLMVNHFEKIVPGYELINHKGYSTPPHKRHIRSIGHSIIHRMNFLSRVWAMTEDQIQQQSLLDISAVSEQIEIQVVNQESYQEYQQVAEHSAQENEPKLYEASDASKSEQTVC